MNTQKKGNIGLTNAMKDFSVIGGELFLPVGDGGKVDLIVILNNIPYKIQCKLSDMYDEDIIKFNLNSSNGDVSYIYHVDEIDLFYLYDLQKQQSFLISRSEIDNSRGIYLRYASTKNNQEKGIKWAKDYLFNIKIKEYTDVV